MKKPSKEVAAAIVGGLIGGVFGLGAGLGGALIGKWDTFFPPSTSIKPAEGNWKVLEQLKSNQDNVVIDWKYKASVVNPTTLSLEGKKVKANNKNLAPEEASVTSAYNLIFNAHKAEGKYSESNAKKPDLSGTAKLTFSETFTSFEGITYDNSGREVSTLHGSKIVE
jgi:hypothetical protein